MFKRGKKSNGGKSVKVEHRAYDRTFVFVCVSVRLSTCSPQVHTGERELRMRSKANKFIGGLHNSAAIPGVIVFPLSLSCRDESLMRSCLVIMDGMDRLPPCPAAEAGSR